MKWIIFIILIFTLSACSDAPVIIEEDVKMVQIVLEAEEDETLCYQDYREESFDCPYCLT